MGKKQIRPVILFKCLSFLFLITAPLFLYAQEVKMQHSGSGDFTVASSGRRANYKGGTPEAGSLTLKKDEVIQTGPGSFVELRMEPGGTRIKIAENTSLVFNGPGQGTRTASFTLVYGRIRIATRRAGDGHAVYVRASQVEAVFRQGDASIDFIVNPGKSQLTRNEPIVTVYNFSGHSELRPLAWSSGQSPSSGFQVHEYEALTLESANSLSYIERKPVEDYIIYYWNRHNFSDSTEMLAIRSGSPVPVPATAPEPGAEPAPAAEPVPGETASAPPPPVIERVEIVYTDYVPAKIEYIFPDNPYDRRLFRIKNGLISTGMLFIAGGIAMQITGSVGIPSLDTSKNKMIYNLGFIPMVTGLIFTGASLVIMPQNMVKNAAD